MEIQKPTKAELEARLKQLEHEYSLARYGLRKGMIASFAAMSCGLLSLGLVIMSVALTGREVLTSTHLVITFAILAIAVTIYFAFVFGRTGRIRMEISKTKKSLEMISERTVR